MLEDWQFDALRSLSEREGKSMSEVLREILSTHFRTPRRRKKLQDIAGIASIAGLRGREHDLHLYGAKTGR